MTDFNFCKVDERLGIVLGWALVSKIDGQDYYDAQGDHVPEDSLTEAAAEFMKSSRAMGVMHDGKRQGDVLFCFPLTEDTKKAFGLTSNMTGLMIGVKPDDPAVLKKYMSGELRGFSIGGSRVVDEVENAA